MSKISVIIPCFNAASYIEKCLAALEEQLYKDFDVILVDDCSTDQTQNVIEQYKKTSKLHITVEKNDVNSGPAASRSRGIRTSCSEYVTFCDSDDWYEKDFLLKMITAIEQHQADMAFCGYHIVSEDHAVEKRPLQGACVIEDKKEALALNVDSMCMLMVRRTIIADCPWPDIRNGEDMAIVPLLICACNKYCVVQDCLYNYLTRASSASNAVSMKVVDALEQSFSFIQEHMPKEYALETEYIGMNNWLYAGLITLFSIGFDTKKARQILADFEKTYPDWSNHPMYDRLAKYKKLILCLAKKRMFLAIKIIAWGRLVFKKS